MYGLQSVGTREYPEAQKPQHRSVEVFICAQMLHVKDICQHRKNSDTRKTEEYVWIWKCCHPGCQRINKRDPFIAFAIGEIPPRNIGTVAWTEAAWVCSVVAGKLDVLPQMLEITKDA